MGLENCATVVKIVPTLDQAETEAARLRAVNKRGEVHILDPDDETRRSICDH
jgi:hypothetical protein